MAFRRVLKEGYLKKVYETKIILKRPVQRWYVLLLVNNQPLLESYNSREACVVEGPINTYNLTHCPPVAPQMAAQERSRFSFVIVLPGDKRLTLQAAQADEMEGWISHLNSIINRFGQRPRQENTYGGNDEYGELSEVYAYGDLANATTNMEDLEIANAKSRSYPTPQPPSSSPEGAYGGPPDGSRYSSDSGGGSTRQSHPLPAIPSSSADQGRVRGIMMVGGIPLPSAVAATSTTSKKVEVPKDWNDPFVFSVDPSKPPQVPPRGGSPENDNTFPRPRPSAAQVPLTIPTFEQLNEDQVYSHMWDNGTTVPNIDSMNPPAPSAEAAPSKDIVKSWVRELDSMADNVKDIDLWLRQVGVNMDAVDELDDEVYDHLEADLEAQGEWENLDELRTRRNQSVTNVFKPNPKAPDFDVNSPPLQLAGFFEKKVGIRSVGETTDHSSVKEGMLTVQRRASNSNSNTNALFITAGPDATLSALTGAVEALKRQILNPGGVIATFRVNDLRNAVAFVEVNNSVWIAGWNPKTTRLNKLIHIGDEVIGVNEMCPKLDSVKTLTKLLDALPREEENCHLRLRRLPHAKVLAIRRDYQGQNLGITRVGGRNEIDKITPRSLAERHGLTSKCKNFDPISSGSIEGKWCLTEVNGRTLNMYYTNNEADILLSAMGLEISLVVQPADLVKKIRKVAKGVRRYRGFEGHVK